MDGKDGPELILLPCQFWIGIQCLPQLALFCRPYQISNVQVQVFIFVFCKCFIIMKIQTPFLTSSSDLSIIGLYCMKFYADYALMTRAVKDYHCHHLTMILYIVSLSHKVCSLWVDSWVVLRSKRNRQQAYLNLLSNDPCHGHSVQNQSKSITNLNCSVEKDTFSSFLI